MVRIGAFRVRQVTLGELGPADIERWRRLDERAAEPYPYLSADYLADAPSHWSGASAIKLLLVEDDDELLVLFPFAVTRVHPRIPLRLVTTADPILSDETSRAYPLVDRGRGREALRALFRALGALGLPRLVDFAAAPADGVLHEIIIDAVGQPSRHHERGRAALAVAHFPGAYPTDRAGRVDVVAHHRSASTRKQARQRLRGLERDLGAELLIRDRSDDTDLLDDFLALQSRGWKGDAQRHGLAYRLTGRDEWFRRSAARFREDGRFEALELHAQGRTVYIALGLSSGRTLFGWQDAYDEAAAPHSLGALGRAAFVNWVARRGYDMLDPNMSWSYVEAARIFPDRREQVRILCGATGVLPRAAVSAFALFGRAREVVRERRARVAPDARSGRSPEARS